jgi:hypothetical protein
MNPAINILIFFTILNGLLFSVYGDELALMPYMRSTVGNATNIVDAGNFTVAKDQSSSLSNDVAAGTGFSIFNVVKTVWNIIATVFNFSAMPIAMFVKLGFPNVVLLIIAVPIVIIYILSLVRYVFTGG